MAVFGRKPDSGEQPPRPSPAPDWSPYARLDEAVRVHLRDSALALDTLGRVLAGRAVYGFVLECYPGPDNALWQEATVCDGARLLVWQAQDSPQGRPPGSFAACLRVVPLARVAHVEHQDEYLRDPAGSLQRDSATVAIWLGEGADAPDGSGAGHGQPPRVLRYVKSVRRDGPGQVYRLGEFARLVAAMLGPGVAAPAHPAAPAQPTPPVPPPAPPAQPAAAAQAAAGVPPAEPASPDPPDARATPDSPAPPPPRAPEETTERWPARGED